MKLFPYPLTLGLLIFASLLSITHSQSCQPSYFFNGQRCAPCNTNCICSQENSCTSCLSGYTYDALFQNCLQCPIATDSINIGCLQCCYQVQGPAFVCSSCQSGPYVYQIGGQCINVNGCTSISNQGVCTNCISGFYLTNGICVTCDVSCATCLDSTLCLTCMAGYYNSSNVNNALCQLCMLGCNSCTTAATCISCALGYTLTSQTCTACSAYCLNCTVSGCTVCNSLSGLILNVCYLCTDGTKQGSTGCLTCTSSATRIICTSCANGYYLNIGTQLCIPCSTLFANSILCNSTNVIQCANDNSNAITFRYYLVNNLCVPNINSCKDMLDSTGKCSTCYPAYTLTGFSTCSLCNVVGCLTYSSTCQCIACQNGYQFINSQCIACQNQFCYLCQASVTACQGCAPYYGRMSSACQSCQPLNCFNCDGDNTVCVVCSSGYYLSNGLCYQCQTNCLSCLSNTQCTTCAANSYLQSNGRCKALPSYCIQIDNTTLSSAEGSCKRCLYGYILLQGNCYPCSLSLFNLGLCDSYHCPNYYAQLSWQSTLGASTLFFLGLLVLN